jgi:hypothetical protein
MTQASPTNRDWIASELAKDVNAKRALAADARTRAASPPESSLGVVYHEIAAADERNAAAVETIAVRYGHDPSHDVGGGIGAALGRFRDRAGEIGAGAMGLLSRDLEATADAIHRHTAWVHAFGALGDAESARELAAVLAEEQTHRQALQQGLCRLVEQKARGGEAPEVAGQNNAPPARARPGPAPSVARR